jgi:hypothetical protein
MFNLKHDDMPRQARDRLKETIDEQEGVFHTAFDEAELTKLLNDVDVYSGSAVRVERGRPVRSADGMLTVAAHFQEKVSQSGAETSSFAPFHT